MALQYSSTLAWKIPWTEKPGRLQFMGSLGVRYDWVASLSRIGEGNDNPLQCSSLENPRDGGAWWAVISGVAQSWTQLSNFFPFSLSCIGEGDGNPLQCSSLENPRDGRAWWAAVYGVAQDRTRLKRLSSSSNRSRWRGQWHPTPVLSPGKSHGRRSLVGCSPWGR